MRKKGIDIPVLIKNEQWKKTDIKNRTHDFFDDIINIQNLDRNNIKINEKPHKNVLIYYIGYVTVNDLSYAKN